MSLVPWRASIALALAAAVSLGLSRFSYALLLPPMRAELGWTYFVAGAMNTLNAAGYLAGALLMPAVLRRMDARRAMLAGGALSSVLLAAHGWVRSDAALALLRVLTGAASAASFVGGGVLAARLASQAGSRAGLVLGLYYGGVGLGIVASALALPALAWPLGWQALGALAALFTALTAVGTGTLAAPSVAGAARAPVSLCSFACALAGYAMFGLGYIGYMTFVITLLGELGYGPAARSAFYVLLGLGVIASPWLWAGLLQRYRDGVPLAVLNALLALATVLPVLGAHPAAVFGSALLFGAVFLSIVASTTALVRHNLPPAAWPTGIAAFTTIFAGGQIVGPSLVGYVADGPGGLARGFVLSAALLAAGALLAAAQRPLR